MTGSNNRFGYSRFIDNADDELLGIFYIFSCILWLSRRKREGDADERRVVGHLKKYVLVNSNRYMRLYGAANGNLPRRSS